VNVDKIYVAAGIAEAKAIGYGSVEMQMVAEYALMRWARGEEGGAIKTFLSHGFDLTSAYRIIAAAAANRPTPAPSERTI
jgi:hypothetical protein